MDLAEVVRIIRARWYVTLPLLLLTIALAVGVNKAVPTKYQATSSITLLASESATTGTATVPGSGNPFTAFGSSLNDTADFLVRRMSSTDVANALGARGVTESYAVVLAAAAQGPFMTLSVTGTDPQHILKSIETLTTYTQQELQSVQQQASVRPVDMIRSMVIVPAGPPSAQKKTKTQDVLGAGIGGLVLTFLATFVVENIAVSRRRRRRKVPFGADTDADGDGDVNAVAAESETRLDDAYEQDYAHGRAHNRWDEDGGYAAGSEAETEVLHVGRDWYGVDAA